jgi:hypothetical protein
MHVLPVHASLQYLACVKPFAPPHPLLPSIPPPTLFVSPLAPLSCVPPRSSASFSLALGELQKALDFVDLGEELLKAPLLEVGQLDMHRLSSLEASLGRIDGQDPVSSAPSV